MEWLYKFLPNSPVTLHVSVWVEISDGSRMTCPPSGHAPRERVSWNPSIANILCSSHVTLHVSVWVEILYDCYVVNAVRSRSTWACELKFSHHVRSCSRLFVTLHVSVWVEMMIAVSIAAVIAVTLHVSVWVEIALDKICLAVFESRSTWACELKFLILCKCQLDTGHAPRERVSWNRQCLLCIFLNRVTLHVSVWVEIFIFILPYRLYASRSTWACELKLPFFNALDIVTSHAPRERVSWNTRHHWWTSNELCHAPRERVSWNTKWC